MYADEGYVLPKLRSYPIIQCVIEDPKTQTQWLLTSCCFQGLLDENEFDDVTLSGMGLTIIGNICKNLKNGLLKWHYNAHLYLIPNIGADPIEMPWPGMPDDGPVPLDLAKLPFDTTMFLDTDDVTFKRLPDRQKTMDRIGLVWLPWLKQKLFFCAPEKALRAI